MTYTVFVDDNFHYQDKSKRYELGDFETYQLAERACRELVDRLLQSYKDQGVAADELYSTYKAFGEDPYIVPWADEKDVLDGKHFSAWEYAKVRCAQICAASSNTAVSEGD